MGNNLKYGANKSIDMNAPQWIIYDFDRFICVYVQNCQTNTGKTMTTGTATDCWTVQNTRKLKKKIEKKNKQRQRHHQWIRAHNWSTCYNIEERK